MKSSEIDQIRLELFEQLRLGHHASEIENEIESRFRDFATALINKDIRSLLRATTLIHHLALSLTSKDDAEIFCDRLQELIPAEIKTAKQPLACNELFFIWIGSIGIESLRNIFIWKRSNPHCYIGLWFDSHCLLASHYSRLLRDRNSLNISTNGDLIRFQNRVYGDLKSMIVKGLTFDEALIQIFLRVGDGRIGRQLEGELQQAKLFYQALAHHLTLCDVQVHAATIMDDEFRYYYFREIGLRGNLAAASDILRLHVIQHFGGVYIDCDTLPSLGHVFYRTSLYCDRHNISFAFIDVLKSEMFTQKVAPLIGFPELEGAPTLETNTRKSDIHLITDYLRNYYGDVVALIEQDIDALTTDNAFRPLDEIWLFNDGLLLTGDPHNRNCFNNNVIIANPHSKAVKIIILEMRHRYRYLDRMGAVDITTEEELPRDGTYMARLLNYRFDTFDGQPNVTVILTGPGLIFEVLMGLGFSILKLDDEVSPISLSYALYSRKIGVAFMDQTFHTYDHSRSTWMRCPDGSTLIV